MKLKDTSFEDVIVGASKEMEFSIDSDNHLIFEILRDKMYKDKIGSLCREVASNCRDANRESGTDKPVVITIIEPNQLVYVGHQSISFKDSGIGIRPDRMADIYVKYAASTKRDTNGQTGGFGLGAKTPFAYNDTFTVVTVCDWEGKRMKYYYTAMIDSSRKGKMVLFEEEETTEPTGTEVIVPIKTPEDRDKFENKIQYYTKYWNDIEYVNFKRVKLETNTLLDEDTFMVTDEGNTGLLIDGIPYPLDESGWSFTNLKMSRGHAVIMKFNTGDITISANRESIQYDDDTVEVIKQRTQDIFDFFKSMLEDFLVSFPTYLDACKFKYQISKNMFPEYKSGSIEELVTSAIGVDRYSSKMLTESFKEEEFLYKGRAVVSTINFKHHKIELVTEKDDYSSSKHRVYKEYESLPLNKIDSGVIYYNTGGKSSRRNLTIFDDNSSFFLLTPSGGSSDTDIADELKRIEDDFEIHYHLYQDVTPKPRPKNATPSAMIPAYWDNGYYTDKEDVFYNKGEETLYYDKGCDNPVDHTKVCVVGVERASTRLSYQSNIDSDMSNVVKKEGWKVLLINNSHVEKKISKTKVRTLKEVYTKILADNEEKWYIEAEKYSFHKALDRIASNVKSNVDILPDSLIPNILKKYTWDEIKEADKFSNSFFRMRDKLKIDTEGIVKKFNKNLSKYPMLTPYLNIYVNNKAERKAQIELYINQVNQYNAEQS